MTKIILIARREYLYYLRKRSFLLVAFGIPLLIMIVSIAGILLTKPEDLDFSGETQYGFVDQTAAGLISDEAAQATSGQLFRRFADEAAARAALDDEQIKGYLVIPADYMDTGIVQLYSYKSTPRDLLYYIDKLLIGSISARLEGVDIPAERISDPVELTIRLEDRHRELSPMGFVPLIIIPIVLAFIFTLASQITGGYLMSGLIEEKGNHIVEIIVTSVTPMQWLAGKIIGLGALGITQLLAWVAVILAILVAGVKLDFLDELLFPIDSVIVAIVYFILGYSLIAAIMAAVAVVTGSEQESRQYAGILSIVFFIPYFFLVAFVENSNGTIVVLLSLLPFTAPMGMVMRYGLTAVPWWQLALSILIQIVTALFFVWLAAKIFRWGLLLYGKKPRPRDLFRVIRGRVDAGTLPNHTKTTNQEISA